MAAGEGEGSVVQFVPFVSRLDAGFWHELSRRKLEKYHLSEAAQDITGYYTNNSVAGLSMNFLLEYSAFQQPAVYPPYGSPGPGSILILNTMDTFKTTDKKKLLEDSAKQIWEDINSGAAVDNPSLLSRFLLLTFADLKKYNFYYWFLFPVVFPEQPVTCTSVTTLSEEWTQQQLHNLQSAYDRFREAHPGTSHFLLQTNSVSGSVSLFSLRESQSALKGDKIILGLNDPSTMATNPGWPLRNFLMLAAQQWGGSVGQVDVLCYRDYTREGKRVNSHSLLLKNVKLPPKMATDVLPRVTGWEKNKNKMAPKMVNLSASMDPVRLAESSVDLNLKLMRWRLLPSLDLSVISQTSCLLLGAGTLGCNVARCLMGWGVRRITLLDNSTVSYSNPVRQSLFTFQDCANGGRHKAKAAVESMKLIFPGVQAEAVDCSIPMPGHSVGSEDSAIEKARQDVEVIEGLIKSHDVVFLLMDTRESRWLPTLLSSAHSRICINAALGFDTFMIMRHGFRPESGTESSASPSPVGGVSSQIPGDRLGCYFCSDVVAPTDSTRDRTLDQQCTVSRPGISMVAGALATELMISILQHPLKGLAPSDGHLDDDTDTDCCLGLIPHQIRGFMSRFQNVLPACQNFDKCTACSNTVIEHYRKEGFDFLLKVFNTPDFLEQLTGLSDLYALTQDSQVWELSDDEDF